MLFIKSQALAVVVLGLEIFGILAAVSVPAKAFAEADGVSVLKLAIPKQEESTRFEAKTSGKLEMVGESYPSPVPGEPNLSQGLLVRAHMSPELKTESTFSLLDLMAQKYADWGSSGYAVKEFYWSRSWRDEKSQLTLGRKIEFWSQLDHDWKLGMWQPNSTLDALRPEEQGLTGIFYRHQEGDFEFLGVFSPLFVPTMGPSIREENGSIVADSRWYRSPSSTFILFHQQRRIVYSLHIPDLQDLVTKPGFSMRWSYGKNQPGFWGAASVGYKPINSLLVKYKKTLALSEESSEQDTGSVPLSPAVAYQSIWGGDIGYRFSQSMVSFSYVEDRPVNTAPESSYIVQYVNPMKAYSLHADTKVPIPGLFNPLEVMAGYLKIDGGDYQDYDSQGASQGAVFNQRFNFYNAALLQLQYGTSIWNKKTVSRVSYLRDMDQRGMIGSAALDFYPQPSLALTVGADILGVDDSSDSNKDSGFLNQYRANDRFYAGISYVF